MGGRDYCQGLRLASVTSFVLWYLQLKISRPPTPKLGFRAGLKLVPFREYVCQKQAKCSGLMGFPGPVSSRLHSLKPDALEISSLGHGQQNRMVLGLPAAVNNLGEPFLPGDGDGEQAEEIRFGQVIATAAGE